MGGRLTRSSAQKDNVGHDADTGIVVPAAAVIPRRKSPRLNTSIMSLSTSRGSDDIKASSSSAPKSTVRKTRGRPRRKAAEISSDDTETASTSTDTGGRKKRRSTRVKKAEETATATRTTKVASSKKKGAKKKDKEGAVEPACLPRAREKSLQKSLENDRLMVIGVDEAGRGPLAGPVVAAAALLPVNIPGITDSKKITKEEERERLYEEIVAAPGVRWAAAVVDAPRIDEINILQATMEAMKMATTAIMDSPKGKGCIKEASVDRTGCYVVCGANDDSGRAIEAADAAATALSAGEDVDDSYYALIDGNRVPKEMPCEAEPMVKGDSREYCIGTASLIAKVTRDRLMHAYDELYPEYNLQQHKGYPTAAHMSAVFKHGASPIHRRTFAPLKHMSFDKDGRIVEEEEVEE